MPKFRKKPVVIDAMQFDGSWKSYCTIAGALATESDDNFHYVEEEFKKPSISIETLEGEMRADAGDWIIKGVKGELYPCKPDIFSATYDPA